MNHRSWRSLNIDRIRRSYLVAEFVTIPPAWRGIVTNSATTSGAKGGSASISKVGEMCLRPLHRWAKNRTMGRGGQEFQDTGSPSDAMRKNNESVWLLV